MLAVLGLAELLLLNGQPFTNGLTAIGFLGAAVVVELFRLRAVGRTGRPLEVYGVAAVLVVAMLGLAALLPSAHRQQQRFDRMKERVKEIWQRPSAGETPR